jgi:hypothetical protein
MTDHSTRSNGPLFIVIVLLLIPVWYVASYLALVQPRGPTNYRWDMSYAPQIFWPMEQIDRKLRPDIWQFIYPKKRSSGFVPERAVIESSNIDNPTSQAEVDP